MAGEISCNSSTESESFAGEIIKVLLEMNQDYDLAIEHSSKGGNELLVGDIKVDNEESGKYFVHEIVDQCVIALRDNVKRWEEMEMEMKVIDLIYQVKVCNKERDALKRKINTLERKLAIEQNKVDKLNEQISNIYCNGNAATDELKLVMDKLEIMHVTESIHPAYLIEMHKKLNNLQERIKELNDYLSKYLDFPPEFEEAKKKLAEAQLEDVELQKSIKKLLIKS